MNFSALLQAHVAAASPGPFEGVVQRVRRRRQRQVVGAALGVVLVVGGAALAVGRPTSTAHPQPAATGSPLPGVGKPPSSIVVAGKRLPLLDAYSTRVVLVDSTRSTSVRFKPLKYPDHGDSYCGVTYRAYLLGQDSQSVHVGLYMYGHFGQRSSYGCVEPPAVRNSFTGLQDVVIPLGVPLGNRRVLADKELPVLQTDTLLRAHDPPSGYTRFVEDVGVLAGQADPYDEFYWQSGDRGQVFLQQGQVRPPEAYPDGTEGEHHDVTTSVVVRGRLGSALTRTRPDAVVRCLRWLEVRPVSLCSEGSHPLTIDQLQNIADTLASRYSAHDNALVPTTVVLDGARFELVGDEAIEAVYATEHDDQLEVRGGRDTRRAECGPITRSYVLSEDSALIRIGTYFYEGVDGDGGSCPVGPEHRQTLQLKQPVGDRKVVAVTDLNREVPVIEARD